MKFDLKRPCKGCPFRADIEPYLTKSRAEEIATVLLQDGTFSCHEHNGFDDDGDTFEGERAQHCAGAMIFLEHQDAPNQMMRIAERIGMYDRTQLDMDAPVFEDEESFIEVMPS